MPEIIPFTSDDPRELGIARIIDAPRAVVWRCWTEPALHKKWFCPPPWEATVIEYDLRPGGRSFVRMQGPNGEQMDMPGQFLEVVPQERLSFTDAFVGDWHPGASPFMVGVVALHDTPNGKTRMAWSARHWTDEARDQHLAMGFEQGWGTCAEQLEELARRLAKGED